MCEPITLGAIAGLATGIGTGTAAGAAALGLGAALSTPMAIVLGLTAGAGVMGAASAYQQGQTAQKVAENNARMAEYAAEDAQRRGEENVQAIQRQASQLAGRQRGLMAARGLDLSAGTPSEILTQTDFFTDIDVGTARDNAAREAWASRAEASNMRAEGAAAMANARSQAFSTLLGTAGSVAGKWYDYRGPTSRQPLPGWYSNPTSTRYSSGTIGNWYGPR